jgi:hypothetical protein
MSINTLHKGDDDDNNNNTPDTQFTYEFPLHKQSLYRYAEVLRAPGL